MSKTKSGGSSANQGKQTIGKRLGIKIAGGQPIKSGQIIIRQRGSQIHAGENVGTGRDFTLFAKTSGTVSFRTVRGDKKKVDVLPTDTTD
jgi:large subunit ribosomal protein L27